MAMFCGELANLESKKPMLNTAELIEHLKAKGVKFEFVREENAFLFLEESNNYFKLTAYRKNFDVYPNGDKKGQYINLDFAALQELSTLDMRLRYILIHMCLDIEHSVKVDLIRMVQDNDRTDAYRIVQDFIKERQSWEYSDPNEQDYINSIMPKQSKDIYREGLIQKYSDECPIWAIAEIIHFSELIKLYNFVKCRYICRDCQDMLAKERKTCRRILNGEITSHKAFMVANTKANSDIELCPRLREIEHLDRLLQDTRQLRNAAAHNSCVLNDLSIPKGEGKDDFASPIVMEALWNILPELQKRIPGITKKAIQSTMKNRRIRQIFTVLYAHRYLVKSGNIKKNRWDELKTFTEKRLMRDSSYFEKCARIVKPFELLRNVVDIWSEI